MRRRRILFAGFKTHMEDMRSTKRVIFGELAQEKKCVESLLDDLRAFGINADQWTTVAQDEGQWSKTVEQGAEHFMAKRIAAEKVRAGLRHAVSYSKVAGRTKNRIA